MCTWQQPQRFNSSHPAQPDQVCAWTDPSYTARQNVPLIRSQLHITGLCWHRRVSLWLRRAANPPEAERCWQQLLLRARPRLAGSPASGVTGGTLEPVVKQETLFLEKHGADSSPRLRADQSAKLLWTRTSWFLTGFCFLRTSAFRLCTPVLGFMFHYFSDSPTVAKQHTTCVHCICSFSSQLLCPLHIRRGPRARGVPVVHVGTLLVKLKLLGGSPCALGTGHSLSGGNWRSVLGSHSSRCGAGEIQHPPAGGEQKTVEL